MMSIIELLCRAWILFHLCLAERSFKKDPGLDFKFPPEMKPTPSNVPVGHLRPLGWQRAPDREIDSLERTLSPEEFYKEYGKAEQPVVFRKMLNERTTPALKRWTDDYFKKKFGDIEMPVTVTREEKEPVVKKMTFRNFLEDYEHESWYISTEMPKVMMSDVMLPRCLQCGTYARYLTEAELWMSSGGTASRLHYHADEHLHCLLDGRKDFVLIEKKHLSKLKFVEKMPHSGEGHSTMDTEMVNVFQFRDLEHIPWIYTTIRAGDCLYVPSAYLHQVRSYGRSLSSVIHWAAPKDVSFKDCEKWTLRDDVTLAGTSFMWTNENGNVHLSNKHLTSETLRHHLFALLRKDDILHGKRFKYFYSRAMSKVKKKPPSKEVFRHFDVQKSGILTRDEIARMDKDVLNRVAIILNSAHPHQKIRDEL